MALRERLIGNNNNGSGPVADGTGQHSFQEMKSRLHRTLINRMDLTKLQTLTPEQVHAEVSRLAEAVLAQEAMPLSVSERDRLVSVYEGGSAVAESVLMALSINPERRRVLIADSVHFEYRQTLATYTANLDVQRYRRWYAHGWPAAPSGSDHRWTATSQYLPTGAVLPELHRDKRSCSNLTISCPQ